MTSSVAFSDCSGFSSVEFDPLPPDLDPGFDASHHLYRRIVCTNCGYSINVPIYCGNRFCPVCSAPRLSRVRRRLNWIIQNINPARGYSIKFLTLTIINEPDLPEMLRHLVKSFRKLRSRSFWKNYVAGGSFVLEVTGRPGSWHAHIHAVIESRYIPYDVLLRLWITVSGSRGVWIERIPKKNVVGYLTKYLTKSSVPAELTDDVSSAISGYRLFQPFGSWYGVNLSYQTPSPGCPRCGCNSFIPEDILYRQLDTLSFNSRSP